MSQAYEPRKLFTVEQANAALPLVRAITQDLVQLSREVIERRERLALLSSGRAGAARDLYSEELLQIEDELEKDGQRLQGYVQELIQLGVEPKSGPDGLVDFPSLMDGRVVLLCWKLGESEVLHWHELDAGFRGRQPLDGRQHFGEPARSDRRGLDMISPTAIVAYLALFASVGFLFLFVNLVVGRLVRPQLPNTEKLEVYECGEPTIGSSFVQFDLRFYVVALLFIIFDVEVAFFFPWATVYGKACHLMDPAFAVVEQVEPPILGGDAVSFDHPKTNELTPAATCSTMNWASPSRV